MTFGCAIYHLNTLNLRLQGRKLFISDLATNIFSFESKLKSFRANLVGGTLNHFPAYKAMLEKLEMNHHPETYVLKIDELVTSFDRRFKDFKYRKMQLQMFGNSFSVKPEDCEINAQLKLIDLQHSYNLRKKMRGIF